MCSVMRCQAENSCRLLVAQNDSAKTSEALWQRSQGQCHLPNRTSRKLCTWADRTVYMLQ